MAAETIPALLALRASDTPGLEAIVGDDTRLSYAELEHRSAARAACLVARGVNSGHRVGLLMANGVEWAINAYAVMRIGAVLVPLSTLLRTPELQAQLAVAGVRHLIAAPAHRGRDYRQDFALLDRAALPSLRHLWWADELGDEVGTPAQAVAHALTALVRPAHEMVIIFTSGSSGSPKGVSHEHGNAIRANAAGLADRCIRAGARLYLPMPFFWVGGFAGGLISALNAGITLLTEAIPQPESTLRFLARERVTLFRGWPDQALALARHPQFAITDLSTLTAGSLEAVLPAHTRVPPERRANLFGMTETFGPYCAYPLDRELPESKWGSCGQAFAGMRLRVVEPGSCVSLPTGEIGRIQVGGRNILRGICGREREESFTQDGWYDTGDLGRLDDDGFLFYAGRQDDMVKIRGVNVYPAEIETVLQSIEGVKHAFVTVVAIEGISTVVAAVVPETPEVLQFESLQHAAKERLSAYKLPSRWLLFNSIEQVPRVATGKVDQMALRALLLYDSQARS